MNIQPWLEFLAILFGSITGAYLAVRVELARVTEQIKAHAQRIEDHSRRIERLEGEYFKG